MTRRGLNHSCLLCAGRILRSHWTDQTVWQSDYRIIYRNNTGTFVSGIGCALSQKPWQPPKDPQLRYNDKKEPEELLDVPLMDERAVDGAHGFVIHSACWDILTKASQPGELSLERLLSVCESLPLLSSSGKLHWGHDCEGATAFNTDYTYPWTDIFSAHRTREDETEPRESAVDRDSIYDNPCTGFDVKSLFSGDVHLPEPAKQLRESTDCFSRLPWEVCEMIAVKLSTQDALKLRLVSRTFFPLFNSVTFWLSRFDADGERGHLFEVLRGRDAYHLDELLRVYCLSNDCAALDGMRNRKRVWKLARWILRLLGPFVVRGVAEVSNAVSEAGWMRVSGLEQPWMPQEEWVKFDKGCRSMVTYELDLSRGITQIGIATVDAGISNVTGINIVGRDGGNVQMVGYGFENQAVIEAEELYGFRAAVGVGGVRALQVVREGGEVSRWIGRPDEMPQTHRLVADRPITGLRVSFDGYKITALAVRITQPESDQVNPPSDIRHTALWYPSVPCTNLNLNTNSFTGNGVVPCNSYNAFSWLHFGGEAGNALSHIGGINASRGIPLGLEVVYRQDQGWEGHYWDQLGYFGDWHSIDKFTIDSAGGERIVEVWAGMRGVSGVGVGAFMLKTNRGQQITVGKVVYGMHFEELQVAPGTVITGIYGQIMRELGEVSLGVVSEALD